MVPDQGCWRTQKFFFSIINLGRRESLNALDLAVACANRAHCNARSLSTSPSAPSIENQTLQEDMNPLLPNK